MPGDANLSDLRVSLIAVVFPAFVKASFLTGIFSPLIYYVARGLIYFSCFKSRDILNHVQPFLWQCFFYMLFGKRVFKCV